MKTRKRQIRVLAALVAVLLSLAGCGGDGGGDGDAPANRPPNANAGPDQTVEAGSVVMLVGGGSDADGSIASSQWEQTSGTSVPLSNADQASASFVAPEVDSDTTLVFQLTVTDDNGATASDDVSVTVLPTGVGEAFVLDVSELDDPDFRLQ